VEIQASGKSYNWTKIFSGDFARYWLDGTHRSAVEQECHMRKMARLIVLGVALAAGGTAAWLAKLIPTETPIMAA